MSLEKMTCGVNYTTNLLRDNVNGLIDATEGGRLQKIFKSALTSTTKYTYIVTGDSTRDSVSTPAIPYYTDQLSKLNFDIYNNAFSGQSAGDWKDNVGGSTLQQAIDNTSGTGSTTILEYSFGINRQGGVTPAQAKQNIIDGVNSYLAAKPDAIILFVSPVCSTNNSMESIYEELKLVFPDQFFVSGLNATQDVYGNSDYYSDAVHPNINGVRRLINYIFSEVLPIEVASLMTMYNLSAFGYVSPEIPATVEVGLYSTTTGAPTSNAAWRRLAPIAVEPNFWLNIDHGGERYNVIFMDDQGQYIDDTVTAAVSGETYRRVQVPSSAYEARIIVSADGANYDALNYEVKINYELSDVPYMRQQKVNEGLPIKLPIVEGSLFIDSKGLTGSAGQVATSQGDGTWLWV